MNKFNWILAAMLFFIPCGTLAQVEIDDLDEEETETMDVEEDEYEEDESEELLLVTPDEENGVMGGADTEIPEALAVEVDSLLDLYYTKHYLTPDSSCNFPNFNPVYEKEEYIERLKRLPTVIEMPYNEIVQQYIDRYSGRLRRSVSIMLGLQNFYMPIFEQALEAYGLPLELKYLPVIESALNPKAVSRVGATGLWQFMLRTGKQYGLEVTSLVDERRDPIKSSYAAAHYLHDLYRVFRNWHLVIAAYNYGPENIYKAVRRAGGVKDYWQIYPYLPAETRGYVPAFIAANYIMNYYCEHNICPLLTDLPAKTDTVVVNRDVHFDQIAGLVGIDVNQLVELNPQYRHNIVNGNHKPSAICLPVNYIGQFIDNEDSIYNYRVDELLTKRLEVAVNQVQPTPVVRKKVGRNSRGRAVSRRGGSRRSAGRTVTVRSGDTLSKIAARNHTTVAKLKRMNGIKGNSSRIRKGAKIRVK